ncbi:MAG TPA: dienelactone hydrolase family protein [Candidatus Krumholzibacteria bacterium]|nr:dienelactone hydrolase family protein [Candidatus Krumholzibacteria bacterium]
MKKLMLPLVLLLLASGASAAIQMEPVDYKQGDTTLKGVLVYDDAAPGPRPGVLVVHEWWGLNDYARMRAKMLAEAGYVAFAVDMFGDGKTTDHPSEAGEWAAALAQNKGTAGARFKAAYELFRKDKRVDGSRIAAIGYCMGGSVVLTMATDGMDLKGVASFHGGFPGEPGKGPIKASLLICQGAADEFSTLEQARQFLGVLNSAGADYEFVVYSGAKHSFTNPGADGRGIPQLAYNANADHRSWATLLDFLGEVLK